MYHMVNHEGDINVTNCKVHTHTHPPLANRNKRELEEYTYEQDGNV